jgi:acetyltransferase-like isoleucine patch superfamily enzyme
VVTRDVAPNTTVVGNPATHHLRVHSPLACVRHGPSRC